MKNRTAVALVARMAAGLVLVAAAAFALTCPRADPIKTYSDASAALRETVLGVENLRPWTTPDGNAVITMSYSNGTHRAYVQTGTGGTLDEAWDDADAALTNLIQKSALEPKYLKIDVVVSAEPVATSDFLASISGDEPDFVRGVALDPEFRVSLLPQELDSLRPYTSASLDVEYLNQYFSLTKHPLMTETPETVLAFETRSWLLDVASGEITRLGANGVRPANLTSENLTAFISTAGNYLKNHVDDEGRFQYLLYPQALADVDDYNVVRHAGTLYAMTQAAATSGDPELKNKIDSGIEYLKSRAVWTDDGAALILDDDGLGFSLGTAGLTMLALENYAVVFDSDEHDEFLKAVANGVVARQLDSGIVPHVLDRDFSVREQYRTIYYDGEALFGLCRTYARLGDESYLDAAVSLASVLVESQYWRYRDHWVAYAMNEMTKLFPDEVSYYETAFLNVSFNVDALESTRANGPTNLELLTATLETYLRALENDVPVPEDFEVPRFARALRAQANAQTRCYLFPERAMYSAACDEIIGSFYDCYDETWEIRIDMVQHHISGLWRYLQNLDAIERLP